MMDHAIMYALDFVSYLDSKLTIVIRDGTTDTLMFRGTKQETKNFLKNWEDEYIMCDTSSMYLDGMTCTLYVEPY